MVKYYYDHLLLVGDFNYGKLSWEFWVVEDSGSGAECNFPDVHRRNSLFQHVDKDKEDRINHIF
jgi:hypothetical protein